SGPFTTSATSARSRSSIVRAHFFRPSARSSSSTRSSPRATPATSPASEREAVLDAAADLVKQGLLTPDAGSDFYRRTEEGRLALAGPRDVTMYMREGCHLCEEAKAAMAPVLAAFGAR